MFHAVYGESTSRAGAGWRVGVALSALLMLAAAGGCSTAGRRADRIESPAPDEAAELVASLRAMVHSFPLHVSVAVRAVENARAARDSAEAGYLAVVAEPDSGRDRMLAEVARSAGILDEAFRQLDTLVARKVVVEDRLSAALRLTGQSDGTPVAAPAPLSRGTLRQLRRLHAAALEDYRFVTDTVLQLKARWLMPDFEGHDSGE